MTYFLRRTVSALGVQSAVMIASSVTCRSMPSTSTDFSVCEAAKMLGWIDEFESDPAMVLNVVSQPLNECSIWEVQGVAIFTVIPKVETTSLRPGINITMAAT